MSRLARKLHGHCATYCRQVVSSRQATTLVIAEHDNVALSPSSLSAVTAAKELQGDVTLLVLGHEAQDVAQQVRRLKVSLLFLT